MRTHSARHSHRCHLTVSLLPTLCLLLILGLLLSGCGGLSLPSGTTGSSPATPAPATAAEAASESPAATGGILVKSGNELSSEEKGALLKELEAELDALFAEIENVSDEEELEEDIQTDSMREQGVLQAQVDGWTRSAFVVTKPTGWARPAYAATELTGWSTTASVSSEIQSTSLSLVNQTAPSPFAIAQNRPAGAYMRKLRASNQLARRILAMKADILTKQEPLLQRIRLRISDPQAVSGDQLVALKDSLKTMQALRVEARQLNADLLGRRLAFRERRLARDVIGASDALDPLMQTQTSMVETLEGILSLLSRMEQDL